LKNVKYLSVFEHNVMNCRKAIITKKKKKFKKFLRQTFLKTKLDFEKNPHITVKNIAIKINKRTIVSR
jgi:hypothetical protein